MDAKHINCYYTFQFIAIYVRNNNSTFLLLPIIGFFHFVMAEVCVLLFIIARK